MVVIFPRWKPSKCGRCARPLRGMRKAKSRGGQAKLIEPERAIERKNVRLCSPMFAYVRLIGEKMLRDLMGNVRKPQKEPRSQRTRRKEEGRRKNAERSRWRCGHYWGLQNARNDEPAKPVRNRRRAEQPRTYLSKINQN